MGSIKTKNNKRGFLVDGNDGNGYVTGAGNNPGRGSDQMKTIAKYMLEKNKNNNLNRDKG